MRNKIFLNNVCAYRQRLFFCNFFKNNEHISYDKKLTEKIRRKKVVVAIVENFVVSTEISHYSTKNDHFFSYSFLS